MHTRRSALMLMTAALPLWAQSRKSTSTGGDAMPHPVVYFEIGCKDLAKTEKFFGELFGWKTQRNGITSTIDTGSQQGVPGHMTALGHEPQHYTIFYVEVDDLQAYLDKATALGGKTLVPPVKIPTGGAFAWFSDPEGNMIGLTKRA
jgi:predicted enzyme related to lactoylglutathione lyase